MEKNGARFRLTDEGMFYIMCNNWFKDSEQDP